MWTRRYRAALTDDGQVMAVELVTSGNTGFYNKREVNTYYIPHSDNIRYNPAGFSAQLRE